jgi:hypothetical protein
MYVFFAKVEYYEIGRPISEKFRLNQTWHAMSLTKLKKKPSRYMGMVC